MKRMGKWLYNNYERGSFQGNKDSASTAGDDDSSTNNRSSFDFLDDNKSHGSSSIGGDPMDGLWRVQQEQMLQEGDVLANDNNVPQVLMLSASQLQLDDAFASDMDSSRDVGQQAESGAAGLEEDQHHHHHHNHSATGGESGAADIVMVATEEDATQTLLQEGYGKPLSQEDAAKQIPPSSDGLVWKCVVVPDEYCDEHGQLTIPELMKRNKKDFDPVTKAIRPQRPSLPVSLSDFRSSLTKTEDGRWIFHGVLNGWPALRTLEVLSVEHKRTTGSIAMPQDLLKGEVSWVMDWKAPKAPSSSNMTTTTTMDAGALLHNPFAGF